MRGTCQGWLTTQPPARVTSVPGRVPLRLHMVLVVVQEVTRARWMKRWCSPCARRGVTRCAPPGVAKSLDPSDSEEDDGSLHDAGAPGGLHGEEDE